MVAKYTPHPRARFVIVAKVTRQADFDYERNPVTSVSFQVVNEEKTALSITEWLNESPYVTAAYFGEFE